MAIASTVERVDPADFDWSMDDGPAAALRQVVAAATAEDGAAPLDEAALLALRHGLGGSELWSAGSAGFAWRHDQALELVVSPAARGAGLGTALAVASTGNPGPLTAWSHGHHPAAAALAAAFGFDRVRDLWVMRRSLHQLPGLPEMPEPAAASPGEVEIRPFRVGRDEDAFLAVNAAAFAHHPEQGGLRRAELDERIAEPWFDPAGFFLAWRGDELVGFHWTKVHDDEPGPVGPGGAIGSGSYGEVYVVGIAPGSQGGGLGRRLTLTGLQHLASRGLDQVLLYVEGDNAPAIAVYSRLGFEHAAADTHVQYARG
jgi:mycothiol synthase